MGIFTAFSRKMDRLQTRIGGAGFYLVLFSLFLGVHLVFSSLMSLPSVDPHEFTTAAYSAYFMGKDWSGVLSQSGYYYGYLQSLVYLPFMLWFDQAETQYHAMLAFNSIMVSLIPLIAYRIAFQCGIKRVWQAMTIAFCSGFYCSYLAYSKFIWTEPITVFMPWLLLWMLFWSLGKRKKVSRGVYSILLGFVLAASYAANQRLLAVIIACIAVVFVLRYVFGKKTVYFSVFIPSLIVFFVLERVLCYTLQQALFQKSGAALMNTTEYILSVLPQMFTGGNIIASVQALFGQLYYFVTASWGMGAVFLTLVCVVFVSMLYRNKTKKQQLYTMEYAVLILFVFLYFVITLVISIAYKYASDHLNTYQDAMIFGRFLDSLIPMAFISVLLYLFLFKINYRMVLGSFVTAGLMYLGFYAITAQEVLSSSQIRVSAVLGLYPIRLGEDITDLLTYDAFLLTTSGVFCILAAFLVIVSCSSVYTNRILACVLTIIVFYSGIYTTGVYLPFSELYAQEINKDATELSQYLFNSADAPPIAVYRTSRHTASMLQFMNQKSKVIFTQNQDDIPENCFIVLPKGEVLYFVPEDEKETPPVEKLNQTDGYNIYAYGERALAYAKSQGENTQQLQRE